MNNFKDFYETVSNTPNTTGQTPKIGSYFLIRIADNLTFLVLVIVLVALTVFFAWHGLSQGPTGEANKWSLNAANLCLGAFLGLFAGKTIP